MNNIYCTHITQEEGGMWLPWPLARDLYLDTVINRCPIGGLHLTLIHIDPGTGVTCKFKIHAMKFSDGTIWDLSTGIR